MWAVKDNKAGVVLGLVLLPIWDYIYFGFFRFSRFVAPRAFDRWAVGQGFQVTDKHPDGGMRGLLKRMEGHISGMQVSYHFTVQDADGIRHSGRTIVGSWSRPSLSVDRCPSRVIWDRDPDDLSG